MALGSNETAYLEGSRSFVEALRRRGGDATLVVLGDLGHDGTALAMGDPASPLVQAMLRIIGAAR